MWFLKTDDEILNIENFSRLKTEAWGGKWHVVGYLRNHPSPPREMYECLSGLLDCRTKARSFLFYLQQAMQRKEAIILIEEIEDEVEKDMENNGYPCKKSYADTQANTYS